MSDKLTPEQVQDVLNFSEALYIAEKSGFYTPYLSNELLKNLNNNPLVPTIDKIKEALASYKQSGESLQSYTEFMSNFDMIFKRTLWSYVNTLAFDLNVICTNAFTQSDYESSQYLEDKRRVYDFLDKFNYVDEFRKVTLQLMLNEVYFTWFRKTKWGNKGMKYALQIMPQQYCMLTGYWEHGLLFDFDMSYFLQPGVDIDGFDPVFKEYYQRTFGNESGLYVNYRPTNPLNARTGEYAYWVQTSPMNGSWVFKMNPSNFTTVPYLAPFLKDAIRNDDIEQLQYDKDMLAAYGILAGEIRMRENSNAGEKADQFALNPTTLGTFMGKVKAGLDKRVKAVAMPTENTKFYQFSDSNSSMYENQLANSAGVGSGISRVIYSSDRMSNAEIEAGIIDQYNTMKPLYNQFSNFLNFYVNQITKKFKFKFVFDGCSYPFEREKRFDKAMKLAEKGMVLSPGYYASLMGIRPQDFERMLEESKYGGWNQLWQTPLNSFAVSSNDEGGRPRQEGSVNDSTEGSRNSEDGLE